MGLESVVVGDHAARLCLQRAARPTVKGRIWRLGKVPVGNALPEVMVTGSLSST